MMHFDDIEKQQVHTDTDIDCEWTVSWLSLHALDRSFSCYLRSQLNCAISSAWKVRGPFKISEQAWASGSQVMTPVIMSKRKQDPVLRHNAVA